MEMTETYNKAGIEGGIISGESLSTYENILKFETSLLKGKTVLNFGCGGSNLSQQVKHRGIDCKMVELDLEKDPSSESSIGYYAKPVIKIVDSLVNADAVHEELVELGRKLSGIKGRTFVQGDGRNLPFDDATFDVTFALKAVYQLPARERPQVLAELLRVSKAVHIAPVMTSDFDTLLKLAHEMNYEVVLCAPIDVEFENMHGFPISTTEDYARLVNEIPFDQRVKRPPSDEVNIVTVFGKPIHAGFSGGVMILKKRD